MKFNNVDWKKYREQFPEKYWKPDFFEICVPNIINNYFLNSISNLKILDLAGGVNGTECLKNINNKDNFKIYYLDKFIEEKPIWSDYFINWNEIEQFNFDAIVCRGAINYLIEDEFEKLSNCLNSKGIIIFNTFLVPPKREWQERELINSNNIRMNEKVRLCEKNTIEHELIFQNSCIKHLFYYYEESFFVKYFKLIEKINYKSNSAIFVMSKK